MMLTAGGWLSEDIGRLFTFVIKKNVGWYNEANMWS